MKKAILLLILGCILTSCPYTPEPDMGDIYFQEYSKFFPFSQNDTITYVNEVGEKMKLYFASMVCSVTDEENGDSYIRIESYFAKVGDPSNGNKLHYSMEISQSSSNPENPCTMKLTLGGKLEDEDVSLGNTTYEMSRQETLSKKSFNITKRNDPTICYGKIEKDKGLVKFSTNKHSWKLKR